MLREGRVVGEGRVLREGAGVEGGVEGGRGCCGRGWGRVLREGVEGGRGC